MPHQKLLRKLFHRGLEGQPDMIAGVDIPEDLVLDADDESGVFLGIEKEYGPRYCVGKASEQDGNVLITGTTGSGKSRVCVKSTIETWHDPFVALDIKGGELSAHYEQLRQTGRVTRPYVIFDPIQEMGHYNPYELLDKDDSMFVPYVRELAQTIIPMPINTQDRYWIDMARNVLCAAIVYYFSLDCNFIDTILAIQNISSKELCQKILNSDCELAKMFLRRIASLKDHQRESIFSEMERNIVVFATDVHLQESLSVDKGEDFQDLISWKKFTTDAETPNIFLRLDQDKLEHWGSFIRLMLIQLVRHLERRPDRYSTKGKRMKPILLLLDEVPLLGRMDIITNALSTLRSKKVTTCLIIQSLAQLDAIYGKERRRIIVENCQYKMILTITEPESQKYFSEMIGEIATVERSVSGSYDPNTNKTTNGWQMREAFRPRVRPEAFARNPHILLHTEDGLFMTIKQPMGFPNIDF